jgi:hypothetical protein
MRAVLVVILALGLATASAQTPPAPKPQEGTTIYCRHHPKAQPNVSRLYPRRAARERVSGVTELECRLGMDDVTSMIGACLVAREEPADRGFGAAGQAVAAQVMSLDSLKRFNGRNVMQTGGAIRLAINWQCPR